MQKRFKAVLGKASVYLLASVLSFAAHSPPLPSGPASFSPRLALFSSVEAQASEPIPAGWESYTNRPDILKLDAAGQHASGLSPQLTAAHFSFVAELLEIYSKDTEIYFLARDSEHLFDVARLFTAGTVEGKRIHLLNVSRANMRDANLKGYLRENGISEETLSEGRKVLFVDTGFSGTIPRVISENFPESLRQNLRTHLVVSSNADHPSSRAFLIHVNPLSNDQPPSAMHGSIVSYEHMARFTDRSSRIIFAGGHYQPISEVSKSSDGSVSKSKSLHMMQSLREAWDKTSVQEEFNRERAQLRKLKLMLTSGDAAAAALLKNELVELKGTSRGRLLQAQVRDLLETQANAGYSISLKLKDLGFEPELAKKADFDFSEKTSKKNALIKQYPEWAPVLENPDDAVPKLFASHNWQMIGNLIDANVDAEVNQLLAKSLFDGPATGIKKNYQVLFLEKADSETLRYIASKMLTQPNAPQMQDLMIVMIKRNIQSVSVEMAERTFAQTHVSEMREPLKLLVETGDQQTLIALGRAVFSRPESAGMKDLFYLLIKRTDMFVLGQVVRWSFSKPHMANEKSQMQALLRKNDWFILRDFAEYVFSRDHTKDMTGLLKLLIEQSYLVNGTGDDYTREKIAQHVLSKPHATGPEYDLFRAMMTLPEMPAVERIAWMNNELRKIGSPLAEESEIPLSAKPYTGSTKAKSALSVCSDLFY